MYIKAEEKPSSGNFKDLEGNRYNRFLVISYAGRINGRTAWWMICDCGEIVKKEGYKVKRGDLKSCGCLKDEIEYHGMSNTKFYQIWKNMRTRCRNNTDGYKDVEVCNRWDDEFLNFKEDMYQSYQEKIEEVGKENISIERIDNDKNYNQDNCQWIDYSRQGFNKSNNTIVEFNGEERCLSEWAQIYGIAETTLRDRIFRFDWPIEKALNKEPTEENHNV